MKDSITVPSREFAESLKEKAESFLKSVMEAVNQAPDGEWIGGSEEQVRDLSAEFREHVFQQAVQSRIDAAEAAFSPSAGSRDGSGNSAADHQTVSE